MVSTSKEEYIKRYGTFINTMRRLKFSDNQILATPISEQMMIVFAISCCVEKRQYKNGKDKDPNRWNTIRGKLRALDFINECAVTPSVWHKSFVIKRLTDYLRKYYCPPEEPSDPFSHEQFIFLIKQLTNMIYDENMNVWANAIQQFGWELVLCWFLITAIMGFRISETVKQPTNAKDQTYGLKFKDINFLFYTNDDKSNVKFDNKFRNDIDNLFAAELTIRNSKGQKINKPIKLYLGRSFNEIDPLITLYNTYHKYDNICKNYPGSFSNKPNDWFFQKGNDIRNGPIYHDTNSMRKKFNEVLEAMNFIGDNKLTPHSLRKYFNTRHQHSLCWNF